MSDNVSSPEHYIKNSITLQPIELSGRLTSTMGQIFQYVIRRKDKNTEIENLEKAVYWLKWYWNNTGEISGKDVLWVSDPEVDQELLNGLIRVFGLFSKDLITKLFVITLFCKGAYITEESVMATCEILEDEIIRLRAKAKVCAESHLDEIGEPTRSE